jgi:hypothetical protein
MDIAKSEAAVSMPSRLRFFIVRLPEARGSASYGGEHRHARGIPASPIQLAVIVRPRPPRDSRPEPAEAHANAGYINKPQFRRRAVRSLNAKRVARFTIASPG